MRITVLKDGNILVHDGDEVRVMDKDDPLDILPAFRAPVAFQPGLTVLELLTALRPWSVVLSAAGWMDFEAWYAAMSATGEPDELDESERLAAIELFPYFHAARQPGDGGKQAAISFNWRPLGRFATPRVDEAGKVDAHCSISFCDPRLIGSLPISISKIPVVERHVLDCARTVLRERQPGIYERLTVEPSLFDTIVLGFLDEISFFGNPDEAAEAAEELRETLAEIRLTELGQEA